MAWGRTGPLADAAPASYHVTRGLRAGWEAQGQAGTFTELFPPGRLRHIGLGQQHIKVPPYSLPGTGPPPCRKPGTAKDTLPPAQRLPLPVLA